MKASVRGSRLTRAERLAQALKTQSLHYVLCHSDIHAGNILLDVCGGLYIVD